MPDSVVRGIIQVVGAPEAIAVLRAYRTELSTLATQRTQVALSADTTALKAASGEVATLRTAHQSLGSQRVALGVDTSSITQARGVVQGMQGDLLSLADTAMRVAPALGLVAAAGGITKFAADYQTMIVQTANQTTLATSEIKLMDQAIRDLPTAGASLQSVASAFKNVTDLGYSAADAQKVLAETTKAATSTGSDQATVALAIASAMKEYNATADQAAKYTNTVAEAAKLGNTTMDAWTEGTRRAVAVASAFGVPLQEVDAALVAMTRHGFDAAESTTQIAALMQHIVAPSKQAQAEIDKLSKTTGIDLVRDFSLAGLQTRGLSGILTDLRAATAGNEEEIYKIIPALRGGQGALILTTQAAGDFSTALGDLGETMAGTAKPVEEGFARIQQTAGYQWGTFVKQLKLDAVDIGTAFLPVATTLGNVLGTIPAPVIEATARLALLAAGVKSAGAVIDLLSAGIPRMIAGLETWATGETTTAAATARDTAAINENTLALERNAQMRTVATTALASPLAEGEMLAPTVLAGSAAAKQQVAMDAEIAVRAVDTAAAETTILAAAVGIGKTLGRIAVPVGIVVAVDQIIGTPVENAIRQWASEHERPQIDIAKISTTDEGQMRQDIQQQIDTQQRIVDEYLRYKEGIGYKVAKAYNIGGTLQSDTDYQNALKNIDALVAKRNELATTTFKGQDLGPPLPPGYVDQVKAATAATTELSEADKILLKNISEVNAAPLAGLSGDLAKITQNEKDVAAAAKSAEQTLAGVDLSKGIGGLVAIADKLNIARDDLAKLGQTDTSLNNLASIANQFKQIADAEDQASAAYNGYTTLLTNTNQYESKLGAYKKELDSSVQAAQQAQARGTATPEQLDLLKNAPAIYANIAQTMAGLEQHKAGDLLNIARNMPDWLTLDTKTRAVADNLGGIKNVEVAVKADTDAATAAIKKIEMTPYTAVVHLVPDTSAMPPNAALGWANPTSPTGFPPLYTTQPGQTDPTRGYGDEGYADEKGITDYGTVGPPYLTARPTSGGRQVPQTHHASDSGGAKYDTSTIQQTATKYQPLSYAEYMGMVPATSPLHNQASYDALIGAAKEQNVNPRLLLTLAAQESSYGTSGLATSARTSGGYNDIGLTYSGAFQGEYINPAVSNSQGQFASFPNEGLMWQAAAQNVQRGPYAAAYQSGDVNAIFNTWGGGAAKSSIFAQMGGSGDATQVVAQAGNQANSVLQTAQASLQKASGSITGVFGLCEKFVDDVLQRSTGLNNRFASADAHIRAAMAGDPNAGTVISASQARPGDIVGWRGDQPEAGDPAGHIGIYAGTDAHGNPQYIGTDKGGVSQRAVAANATYIRPPGGSSAFATGAAAVSNFFGANPVGNVNYTDPAAEAAGYNIKPMYDATAQARILQGILPHLDSQALQRLNTNAQQFQQYRQGVSNREYPTDQAAADKATHEATLNFIITEGRALEAAKNPAADLSGYFEKMRQTSGAMADYAIAQVQNYRDVATTTAKIALDQKNITDLEASHTATLAARQSEDTTTTRARQERDWRTQASQFSQQLAQQDTQYQWTLDSQRLSDRQTKEQRIYDDATTAADRAHVVKMRQIQDETTALDRLAKTNAAGNTVAAESFAALAGGSGTLASKRLASENLAIQNEYDRRIVGDLDKQRLAIADAQIAETRLYEDDKYHRDVLHTQATRGFADEATTASRNQAVKQRQWQEDATAQQLLAFRQQQADTRAQWALDDRRLREDALYNLQKTAADAQLTYDQNHLTDLNNLETATSGVLSNWQQIAQYAGASADSLLSALPSLQATAGSIQSAAQQAASYIQSVAGLKTANGVPFSQFPAPGQFADGGTFSGIGIVGDTKSGNMDAAEAVAGTNVRVFSHAQSVRMGLIGPSVPRYAAGTDAPANVTPITVNAPITINANPDVEATIRRILAPIEAQLRAALTKVQPASRSALGNGRQVG